MPTLTIEGRKVTVDDSFLQMSPEQQNATVDEIARSLGVTAQPSTPAPTPAPAPAQPSTIDTMLAGMDRPQTAAPEQPVNQGIDAPLYVTQRANRGLADALGSPVDLASGVMNLGLMGADKIAQLFGGNVDTRIEKPFMGSDWIADRASEANEAVGGTLVPDEAVSNATRVAGAGARGAAAALPIAFGLASAPAQVAAKAGKPIIAPLAKPYGTSAGATLARDAIAGGGAGVAQQAYDEHAPDWLQESSFSPILKMVASMLGGVGAAGATSAAEGLLTGGGNLLRNIFSGAGDPNAPANPQTGKPYSRTEMDNAARVAQAMPSERGSAVGNIDEGAKEFAQFASPRETPTVGMLADDIGMATQENVLRARDPQRFIERDNARRAAATNKVDATAPRGADSRAFTNEATRQYDDTLDIARQQVADAVKDEGDLAADIRTQNADLEQYRVRQPQASTAMAEDFDAARRAARQEKNARYDAADPTTPVDGRFLDEALNRIDAGMSNAERMNPGAYAEIAGRVRQLTAADGPGVTYGDIKALRAQVSEARKAAVSASGQSVAGSGADVQRLDQLGAVINRLADDINPEAARFYKEEYAPRFKQGRAGEYGAAVDRSTRTGGESSATRPSEFGDKFLRKPEDAASLNRAMQPLPSDSPRIAGEVSGSIAPDAVTARNAEEWMLGDLAKSGVLTENAQIRFDKFKQWADRNRGTIDQFPDLARRVDGELARAQQGGALSKQLADDVAAAKSNLKTTETELRRSALQHAIGNSPENAVAGIMGSGDPEVRMAEMVQRLSGNQDATDGLKAAVRDWIKQKAGTTSGLVGEPDTLRLSRANLDKLFSQHEKTLAKIYSPDEMNALRQAHKLMGAEAKLDVRATGGSNTFDKVMAQQKTDIDQRKRMLEAALKAKYGVLKGGGVFRTINLFLAALPDTSRGLENLLFEMHFNPELAKHLLTRPVKDVNTPAWNSRLNTLMGAVAGGRESTKERKPLEITVTEPNNRH